MRNLPQERLALGVGAVAAAETVLAETLEYIRQRHAFGSPLSSFQNTQFVLAELATELDIAGWPPASVATSRWSTRTWMPWC